MVAVAPFDSIVILRIDTLDLDLWLDNSRARHCYSYPVSETVRYGEAGGLKAVPEWP